MYDYVYKESKGFAIFDGKVRYSLVRNICLEFKLLMVWVKVYIYIWTQIKCRRKWTMHLNWITVDKFVSERFSIFLYVDLYRFPEFHPPWWTQQLWERTPDGSCYCPPPVSPGGSDSTPGTVSTCRSLHQLWLELQKMLHGDVACAVLMLMIYCIVYRYYDWCCRVMSHVLIISCCHRYNDWC